MFTFKKLALVGVAGLAAFSMSCSDPAEEGGEWATPFSAVYNNDGAFGLSGKVTVIEADNSISSVKGTVGGVETTITGSGAQRGDFTGAFIGLPASLCTGKAGQSISVKVEVTVNFVTGEPLTGTSASLSVTCPSGPAAAIPVKTLQVGGTSATIGSFVDLDEPKAYLSAAAKTNAAKIDIVYTVGLKDADNDPFGDDIYTAGFFSSLANADYAGMTGGYILPLELVADAATVQAAYGALTTMASIPADAVNGYAGLFDATKVDTEIPAAVGKVFLAKGDQGSYLVAVKTKTAADITIAIAKVF